MMRSGRGAGLVLRMIAMGGRVSCKYVMSIEASWKECEEICPWGDASAFLYRYCRLSGPDKYPWLTLFVLVMILALTASVQVPIQHSITANGTVY